MKAIITMLFGLFLSLLSICSYAAGPDFSGLTSQIDWGTCIAAVLLVMGGLGGVYVVMTGGSLILSKLRGR